MFKIPALTPVRANDCVCAPWQMVVGVSGQDPAVMEFGQVDLHFGRISHLPRLGWQIDKLGGGRGAWYTIVLPLAIPRVGCAPLTVKPTGRRIQL